MVEKEKRICPKCKSSNVKNSLLLSGQEMAMCKAAFIENPEFFLCKKCDYYGPVLKVVKNTNFRGLVTSSGKSILAGKNAETNEELVNEYIGKENIILHTKEKGSPFCVILGKNEKTSKKDIKEAAIFCARYSQDWKKNKNDVIVHVFKGKDVFKNKQMNIGTFGVKKIKEIRVKKSEINKEE